jgi:xylan 1,4-beta-xylosidase
VSILVWNYADDDLPAPDAPITLQITGLGGGPVREAEFRMDKDHSNAYAVWQAMGSPTTPTPAQRKTLEAAAGLERSVAPHELEVRDGDATVQISLPRQGVALIRLTR